MLKLKKFPINGSAMILSLVMVLILTVIGVAAVNFTSLGERLTNNQRDTQLAFNAAESALAAGENWLAEQANAPKTVSSCEEAPCLVWSKNSFNNLQAKSHDWWQTHARPFPGKLAKVKTQPRFIIEQQEFVASELNPDLSAKQMGSHYYRVTARGTGSSNRSAALVQSIFVVKYN